jgi:hypothetical protein
MKTRCSLIVRLALALCLGMTWGCGSRNASQLPPYTLPPVLRIPEPSQAPTVAPDLPLSADCGLSPGQRGSTEDIALVGLTERVDPAHAPRPSNESERLLFRQLYETLIRVDCEGNAVAGLASAWRQVPGDAGLSVWVVTLRQNARFSDDTPVTATDVVSSWTRGGAARGNAGELRPEVRRIVDAIEVLDERTLKVSLHGSRAGSVLGLAHTDLAIAAVVPGSPWPLGTRGARIDPGSSPVITMTRISENSSVRFLVATGGDGRDLLDRGVDVLLTRAPRTLAYAATLPQFIAAPLAWQRTHVLLTPGGRKSPSFSEQGRRVLAGDAVRGEARGAEGPFWWESLSDCQMDIVLDQPQPPSTAARIIYDADDAASRELAERFVGIGSYPSASGLGGEALAQSLRRGNEAGYIVSLDRRPLDPCREMLALRDSARWLDPKTIVPLVDTRLNAIVRRARGSVIAEWDGGILLWK